MTTSGTLPENGKIVFEFKTEALMNVASGLSKQFETKATISFPHRPKETEKIIHIVIEKVCPTGTYKAKNITDLFQDLFTDIFNSTKQKHAYGRAREYMQNQILPPMCWILVGYLNGKKKIPIMIMYIPALNIGSYAFKKDNETMAQFEGQLN